MSKCDCCGFEYPESYDFNNSREKYNIKDWINQDIQDIK